MQRAAFCQRQLQEDSLWEYQFASFIVMFIISIFPAFVMVFVMITGEATLQGLSNL